MNKTIALEPVLHWFVKTKTQHFDKAHDINHIIKVVSNATTIYNMSENTYDVDLNLILVCCYLHDIRDHKLVDDERTITEDELEDFITAIGYDPYLITGIVNLISFSKERSFESNGMGSGYDRIIHYLEMSLPVSNGMTIEQLEYIRNVVSDADKIEALGETGINRAIEYGRHIGVGDDYARIIGHCDEKLLHLKDVYIRTEAGKSIAQEGHRQIVEWYEEQSMRLFD